MATRRCPHCGTDHLDPRATVCPNCGQDLPPYVRTTRSPVMILGAVFLVLLVLLVVFIFVYGWLLQKVIAP